MDIKWNGPLQVVSCESKESERETVFRRFKDLHVLFFEVQLFFRMISFHFELQK